MSLQRLFETVGPLSYFALVCIFFLLLGLLIGWLLWWARSKRYEKAESDHEIVDEEVRLLLIQNRKLATQLGDQKKASHLAKKEDSSSSQPPTEVVTPKENQNPSPSTPLQVANVSLPKVDGPSVDWQQLDGIDPRIAEQIQQLGICNIKQLEDLSPEDREVIEAKLSFEGMSWNWRWIKDWKDQIAANPAKLLSSQSAPPPHPIQLSSSGVSRSDEWAFGARALFGRSSRSDALGARGTASTDAVHDTRIVAMSTCGAETVYPTVPLNNHDSDSLPRFDLGIPSVKDDLTLLDGIDAEQADVLHQMGIHDFDHLHGLSAPDRDRLLAYFHHRGWQLDMAQWRIASEGSTKDPTMEEIQQKAYDIYRYREEHGLGGWEQTDWDQAEWELRGNPSFGYGVPHHVDDFVETSKITREAKEELYRMGLYNHDQVQALDTDARRLLSRWFAGSRFGIDITSAFNWLSTLQSVPKRNYGATYANRPDCVDDLSTINGVDPVMERELNRIGIFQYRQIAAWDQTIIQSVSQTLDLGDRIQTDAWVAQAQQLADQRVNI